MTMLYIMAFGIFFIFVIFAIKNIEPPNKQTNGNQHEQETQPKPQGQPSKDEFHKVINFMYYNNIITHDEHQKIIQNSLPYIM